MKGRERLLFNFLRNLDSGMRIVRVRRCLKFGYLLFKKVILASESSDLVSKEIRCLVV